MRFIVLSLLALFTLSGCAGGDHPTVEDATVIPPSTVRIVLDVYAPPHGLVPVDCAKRLEALFPVGG